MLTVENKLELFGLMTMIVNDVIPQENKGQLKYNKFKDDDWHKALEIDLYRKDITNNAPYYQVRCSSLCYIKSKDSFELPYGYITVYKVKDGEEDSKYGSFDDVYCISVDDARKKYKIYSNVEKGIELYANGTTNITQDTISRQKEMIDRQWKLLEQCGVSAGGELKRVSYLLEKLRTKNDKLKEKIIKLSEEKGHLIVENNTLKEKTEKLDKITGVFSARLCDKYRQILQEIKAIAKEIADTGNWLNCGYNASRAKKILDLIAKAESERQTNV